MKVTAAVLLCLLLLSCRRENFTTEAHARLRPTVDTLHFDTVFTTAGSTSQLFKIMNPNDAGIRITAVRLGGGSTSPFQINADGLPGPLVRDLHIAARDSAYVFVTVRIDPDAARLPFVVRDSIEIAYNGNSNWVQLEAYGQNARFLKNHVVATHETWTGELPYVVLGSLRVAENAQLTLAKGCRIYAHADAPVRIDGSLQVQGEKWDSTRVLFTGDRLDAPYRDYPAAWPGLVFSATSRDNQLTYCIVNNAYRAISVEGPSVTAAPKLVLAQTIIDNAYAAGLTGTNTSITAQNLLISNCGRNLVLTEGGQYTFTHCTVAAYANQYLPHKEPLVTISNHGPQGTANAHPLTAQFRNCIFWGQGGLVEKEIVFARNDRVPFNLSFDHVLWNSHQAAAGLAVTAALNEAPGFDSINTVKRIFNFRLKENAAARDKGVQTAVSLDLDGQPRPVGAPDLGAYEKQ